MSTATVLALLVLEGIAIRTIMLQPFGNGFQDAVGSIRGTEPYLYPGSTNTTLVTQYTTFEPLDYCLTTLQIAFASIFNGSAPAFSLLAFYFGGQIVPVLAVLMIEGLREGNKGEIVSFPLAIGMLFQIASYAVTMPVYSLIYIFTSLTAVETPPNIMGQLIRISDVGSLGAVIPAIVTGFILPSAAVALRPYYDTTLHQYLVAGWQFFPVLVKLSQLAFAPIFAESKKKKSADRSTELNYLRRTYRFALNAAAFTHVATIVMLVRIVFFPAKIKNPALHGLTPLDVFVPQPFWTGEKMVSFAHAAQGIFLYDLYIGSAAALVLAAALYRVSLDATAAFVRGPSLALELLGAGAFSGFGGILVALMWRRDEEVVAAEERVKQKAT